MNNSKWRPWVTIKWTKWGFDLKKTLIHENQKDNNKKYSDRNASCYSAIDP